ncbi:MAG: HD domain-containing protein [Nitrososphaerales archaeon]
MKHQNIGPINSGFMESAEIRDPIHGYIFATDIERRIIDTTTFQRLRRIRQLAGCHLVYPGGQHSRFEHVIGAMYLAGRTGKVLELLETRNFEPGDTELLRLAALLHDVGHGPFSHMFEEVMAERTRFTHEDMTTKIILGSEIGDILSSAGISKKKLSELAIGKSKSNPRFMNDVIGGGLSADIMDYLPRDSYFTGVEYGKVDIDRIINSFEVVEGRLAIGQAALFAFEALMIARYEMFRAVYFHRTVRAAELMLIKSMILADKELTLTDLSLSNYLALTDEVTLEKIRTMKTGSDKDLKRAKLLADDYYKRRLLKCVFERSFQRRDKFLTSIFTQKSIRDQLAENIASSSGVDPDDVYIDVPTTPSIPVSSTRESFEKITLVDQKGRGDQHYELNVKDMPLVSTIAGFMDIMRVYTSAENRVKVQKGVGTVLNKEGFETKISM